MPQTWTDTLDPDESKYFYVNWAGDLNTNDNERITASVWTQSAQATTDGNVGTNDAFSNTTTEIEITGGVVGTTYPWINTIDTVGDSGKTQRFQLTCNLSVAQN